MVRCVAPQTLTRTNHDTVIKDGVKDENNYLSQRLI